MASNASNQVRFQSVTTRVPPQGPAQGKAQFQANTKGTGREDIPTAIALRSKRKVNLKLPANY